MSVQKRRTKRGTTWVARWEEERRHRQRTFDTRGEAVAFDAEKKAELRRRRQLGGFAPTEASPMLLRDHVERAWNQRGVAWADTTKETWGDILDSWVLPLLGDVQLRDLNRGRVRDFRASMMNAGVRTNGGRRRVASANRANAVMTVLSAFCGFAVEDGLIPENPCRDVHRLPHKASRHRAHLPVVFERIRAEMVERDALMVSLMYLAGLRPEEALALQWRHVGEQVLVVEQAATGGKIKGTKTGAGAHVDLVEPLLEDLAARRRVVNPDPDDLVIAGRQGDGVLSLRPWRQKVWHPARIAADVGLATPYDCRHSFGSLLIHEGRDILEVQRAMRHSSARTTLEHYAHEFAEWKGRAKVTLVEAVRAAREEVAATGGQTGSGAASSPGRAAGTVFPAAPAVLPVGDGTPSGGTAGAGAPASTMGTTPTAVARKLRTADEEEGYQAPADGLVEGMGVTGLEPVTPSLSSLPNASQGTTGDHDSTDASGDPTGDDDPPIDTPGDPRLRESCAPPARPDPQAIADQVSRAGRRATVVHRASSPSPAAPYGRCEDCGDPLRLGLEGTWCPPCELDCPGCGEDECHATCAPRHAATARARRRLLERRVPDRRRDGEQARATRHATWMLAGATR